MTLIKREDAIEAVAQEWLSEASAESPYVNDDNIGEYRKLAEKLFEDVPLAEAEWIPCSDRLPNKGEVVLVCMRIKSHKAEWEEQRSIEFGRISPDKYDFNGTGWEWLNESGADYWQADWNNSILAWMPLPEPYREESEVEE